MPMLARTLALASTAMLLSGPALSATLQSGPFTDSVSGAPGLFDPLSVPQFDANLGTLERVDWEVSGGFDSEVLLFNAGVEPLTVTPSVSVGYLFSNAVPDTLSLTNRTLTATGDQITVPARQEEIVPLSADFSQAGDETTDLAGWIGDGTVGFDVNIVPQEGQTGLPETEADLAFTVTYSYRADVDVIPLPAAGWMLLAALAGLGGTGWLRRRRIG